jgi:RNA polymerase II subunit A-like phosphatase
MADLTSLKLPRSTPFPVKISSIAIREGDSISKHDLILRYSYWEFQDVPAQDNANDSDDQDSLPAAKKVRVDLAGSFDSPIDGIVSNVKTKIGEEILSCDQIIAEIQEPCTHSIQYSGLCALCGKALDEEVDYSGYQYEDRAPISMSHGTSNLKISKDEAEKVEQKWTMNLLGDKKLILVVDLDQTVVHATVDPTIGEWMKDPSNPNYPSLKGIKTFSLEEEPYLPPGYTGPRPVPHTRWYFVKLRPGLQEFLDVVAGKYELHIYTMGTRAYAKSIASCIDPEGKYFADRILSRDESGSLTQKSLERLFPTDTSMVVIIDDRGDVWNWSDHLIKVVPFDFFVGIGDINSNFLPQQKSLLGPLKRRGSIAKLQEKLIEESNNQREASREAEDLERKIEEIQEENKKAKENDDPESVLLSEQQNAELLAARSSEREASLEAQKDQRPLAKLQRNLDELVHNKGLERLLYDDDDELIGLQKGLLKIHEIFYAQHEEFKNNERPALPDIKEILPNFKKQIFKGLTFVFSGLFPLGSNINSESIVIWVKSFGAQVKTEITLDTTHVIAKSSLTYKARLAKSLNSDTKIVHPNWAFHCMTNWTLTDEKEFEVELKKDQYLGEKEVQKYKDRLNESNDNNKDHEEAVVDNDDDQEENEFLRSDMDWLDMDEEGDDFLDSEGDDEETGKEESEEPSGISAKRHAEDSEEEDGKNEEDGDDEGKNGEVKKRKVDGSSTTEALNDNDDDDDDLAAELMLGFDDDDDE